MVKTILASEITVPTWMAFCLIYGALAVVSAFAAVRGMNDPAITAALGVGIFCVPLIWQQYERTLDAEQDPNPWGE